jgi:hypothetical protein
VDLSYFSVFSFTEHIVFSLQAIPFAFFFGVAILCLVFIHNAALRTTSSRRHTRLLIAEGVLAICAAPILHVYSPDSLALAVLFIGIGCLLLLYRPFTAKPVLATYVGVSIAATAFVAGYEQALSEAFEKFQTDTVQMENESIKGRIIRSGENRLMFFDFHKKLITILQWDDVKRITTTLER